MFVELLGGIAGVIVADGADDVPVEVPLRD